MTTSVPSVQTITLDKTRPYATCHGDRIPDDPMYRVSYWQGGKIGKDTVTLPFDSNGELVEDDKKEAPWKSIDAESKPVTYYPLWTEKMRKFRDAKFKKLAERAIEEEEIVEDESDPAAAVDLVAWLRGNARYDWPVLVAACKRKHGINFNSKAQMVTDLVIDHALVKEEELSEQYRKMLPPKAA